MSLRQHSVVRRSNAHGELESRHGEVASPLAGGPVAIQQIW